MAWTMKTRGYDKEKIKKNILDAKEKISKQREKRNEKIDLTKRKKETVNKTEQKTGKLNLT